MCVGTCVHVHVVYSISANFLKVLSKATEAESWLSKEDISVISTHRQMQCH